MYEGGVLFLEKSGSYHCLPGFVWKGTIHQNCIQASISDLFYTTKRRASSLHSRIVIVVADWHIVSRPRVDEFDIALSVTVKLAQKAEKRRDEVFKLFRLLFESIRYSGTPGGLYSSISASSWHRNRQDRYRISSRREGGEIAQEQLLRLACCQGRLCQYHACS